MNNNDWKENFIKNKVTDCYLLKIPKIKDRRGNLAVIENNQLPFDMKRVYYLYDVPAGAYRGGHAHKAQNELLIAVSGSFEVRINDGQTIKKIILNRPDRGLLIPVGIWRDLKDFSQGSVCLVLNSGAFDEDDYIRQFEDFQHLKNQINA